MSIFSMEATPPVRSFNSVLIFLSRACFFKEITPTSRSQASRSRPPRIAVMRNRYRTNFFKKRPEPGFEPFSLINIINLSERDGIQVVREFFQDISGDLDLILCFFPIALFDGF